MKRQIKASGQPRATSGNRTAPRRFACRAVLAVAAGAVVVGLLVWNQAEPKRMGVASTSLQPKPGAGPAGSEPALPEPEQERALRAEQLDAAGKLLAEFPNNDDAAYLAGLVRNEQGDSDTATQLWARSLELNATRADANESLGFALLRRDQYEQAETYLRRALELDPTLHSARIRLATALSQQGKTAEVIAVLTATNFLPAEAHRLLGEAYQQLKEYEKAKASFQTAIRLKPDFAEAYYGLSKTSVQLGDQDKGREYLEKFAGLKKASDDEGRRWRATFSPLTVAKKSVAQTHTDVGRVYMKQGGARAAEGLWLKAAALDPSNTLCRLQLAVLYQQTHQDRDALRRYEEIAAIDPSDGLVQLNLGRVSLKLKQSERAERAFQEVIKLEPKRHEGYAALAELYLQTKRSPAAARELAQTAVALAPEAPNFVLLSRTCAANGDRASALAAIDKAIELQPANEEYLQVRQMLTNISPTTKERLMQFQSHPDSVVLTRGEAVEIASMIKSNMSFLEVAKIVPAVTNAERIIMVSNGGVWYHIPLGGYSLGLRFTHPPGPRISISTVQNPIMDETVLNMAPSLSTVSGSPINLEDPTNK